VKLYFDLKGHFLGCGNVLTTMTFCLLSQIEWWISINESRFKS